MSRFLELVLIATVAGAPALAEGLGLGRPATPDEIAAWDIDIRPDGSGLPEGSGSVEDGEVLFTERCSSCHGVFGEGAGRWPVLAGGDGSLAGDDPNKTVGSYWPYLSTVYDYVHRAMPFGDAQSLTADETYAITAYLLNLNFLVEEDFVLSKENFTEVDMPNEDGFFMDDRMETEFAEFVRDPCMESCKDSVEISARARIIDVTPDETAAREAEAEADATQTAAAEAPEPEAKPSEDATPVMVEPDPQLVADGERVFKKCQACHQVGEGAKNRVGPHLNGVVGRHAAAVEDFRYSKPMAEAGEDGLVWTGDELAAFLADPKGYMKGTKMSFAGLRKDEEIAAVSAYLSTFEN